MVDEGNRTILGSGVSFSRWRCGLQAKLARRDILGHVFHDIDGIPPIERPIRPAERADTQSIEEYENLISKYESELRNWIQGEIEAKDIIIKRLATNLQPLRYDVMTAKALYDGIAMSRKDLPAVSYADALQTFLNTKFTTTADDYCFRFMINYQNVNNAARMMSSEAELSDEASENNYCIPSGLAAVMFMQGTKGVEWLNTWREARAIDENMMFAPLENMIRSMRTIAGMRNISARPSAAATLPAGGNAPNDQCTQCRHRHTNKQCFKQHPELQNEIRL